MSVRSHKMMSGKLLAALLGGILVVTGSVAAAAMPERSLHRLNIQPTSRTADSRQNTQNHSSENTDQDAVQKTASEITLAAESETESENESVPVQNEPAQTPTSQESQPSDANKADEAAAARSVDQPASQTVTAPSAEPMDQTVQSAQPNSSSQPADDGIWHIHYIPARGALSAPADGSIGLWADGWFIAHSGLANGDKIATFPPRVEVDGKTYHLSDTWVSEDAITPQEVARIRANDGIAFQTCIDDATNWMAHYEPNTAGYGYQFTNYPYTVNDDASIGYYPQDYAGSTPALQSAGQPAAGSTAPEESGFQAFDE